MSLQDRLSSDGRGKKLDPAVAGGASVVVSGVLKSRLHAVVIDKLDMRSLGDGDSARLREKLRPSVEQIVEADVDAARGSDNARRALVDSILDEIAGLGPLEALLNDPAVSDILVNHADQVFVERAGKLELTNVTFTDNAHLLNIIQRIVSRVGRRVDESSPMVDARLADGSRVNAVVPPIATDGPVLSIRRFAKRIMGAQDLVSRGVAEPRMMRYLQAAVHAKCNLLISGGTGAGKTTLLNVLSTFIPKHERVITVEDSAELSLQGHHVVRMEARPANIEGRGEVTIRSCVRNALRMRPDRIIIGEVRGGEVLDMLQAMNTGHEGSMATLHSNTPREAMERVMMMLALSGVTLSTESMAQFVASCVRVVVQVARFPDGARRITHIAELQEYAGERLEVTDIFTWSVAEQRFIYHGGSKLTQRFRDHGVGAAPSDAKET